jgi:hypothetical protein
MTRAGWTLLTDERTVTYSPAWFQLVDEITGGSPVGVVRAHLDLRVDGRWHPTGVRASLTERGTLSYPGLERRAVVVGVPPRRYRLRISADRHSPLYRATVDGVEFDAFPHNDVTPPSTLPTRQEVVLLPGVTYPHPAHVRTAAGIVRDGADTPRADVLVQTVTSLGGGVTRMERTLTDARGAFCLPLRWAAVGTTATLTATDSRAGSATSVSIAVPGDLERNIPVVIP